MTSVQSDMKSTDFCAQPIYRTIMTEQKHYFRSMNIEDDEEVNLVDR